jgi:hypothetical protein
MKNIAAAISKTGLRPQISENFPQDGVLAALASKYADPIHVYPAFEWKYSLIVGKAVVMIVVSRAARNTDAPREAMMIVVCSFVREASGSVGDGALGSVTGGGEGTASSSTLVEESFGMSFSEGAGVDSPWCVDVFLRPGPRMLFRRRTTGPCPLGFQPRSLCYPSSSKYFANLVDCLLSHGR